MLTLQIILSGVLLGGLYACMAIGFSIVWGVTNLINLAHGSFAMAGAYITVFLVNRLGVPFFLSLPLAFLASAGIGFLFERTLYSHVYRKPPLDQVLFTIGLVFMSVAATDYVMGSSQVFVQIPSYLQGQFDIAGIGVGRYRLLIIVLCGLLTIALQFILAKTRFGSRLRAAVDDSRVARGLGINVNWDPRSVPELEAVATSLLAVAGQPIDRTILLRHLLQHLDVRYHHLRAGARTELFHDWRRRLTTLGRPVRAERRGTMIEGIAEDVTTQGALLVCDKTGTRHELMSGEVTVRVASF